MGYPEGMVDDVSFAAAADTLYDEGMGMSLLWSKQGPIEDFILIVLKHIEATTYVDPETGLFVLKLIRSDYTKSGLVHFDESNSTFNNPSRPSAGELITEVTVVYSDEATGESASTKATNTALAQMQGIENTTTVQYTGFTEEKTAYKAALRDLLAASSALWSGDLLASTELAKSIRIGDPIRISRADYHIDDVVFRVMAINLADGIKNTAKIKVVEDVFDRAVVTIDAVDDSAWENPTTGAAVVENELVLELPYYELVSAQGQSAVDSLLEENPDAGYFTAVGTEPLTGVPLNALLSVNNGSGFEDRGLLEFSPSANTNADITAVDTVIPIDSVISDDITIGQHVQINNELMRIDGYSDTDIAVGRGILDTVATAHESGSSIVFWDLYIANDSVEYTALEEVSVKLRTVTSGEILALGDTVERNLTFDSRAIRPFVPQNFQVNSVLLATAASNALDFTWAHRDRTQQTSSVFYDHTDGDIGPEVGTTYNITVRYAVGGVTLDSATGLTGTSWSSTLPSGSFDLIVELEAVRDGYASFQKHTLELSYIDTSFYTPEFDFEPDNQAYTPSTSFVL